MTYRALLLDAPDHFRAWRQLGDVLAMSGRLPEAADAFRHGLAVVPGQFEAMVALANVLARSGDIDGAEAAARDALAARPNDVEVLLGLLSVGARAGHFDVALEAGLRAVELAPARADLRWALGESLIAAGRPDQAVEHLREAVKLDPADARSWRALGNALLLCAEHDDARSAYVRAAALAPGDPAPLSALGTALFLQGSVLAAEECYQRAHALGDRGSAFRSALLLPPIFQSASEILEWRARYDSRLDELLASDVTLDDPVFDVGLTSFGLAYHNLDDRALQEKVARLYLRACPSLGWTAPHCEPAAGEARGDRRVRVGILSFNLRHHTIGKVNSGIIANLDRERFEVTVIQGGPKDDTSAAIAASADNVIRLTGTLADMRGLVAAAKLDILFYTDIGMEPISYYLAFARLATVQVVTWGHPDTTGIPNLDYYVSSDLVEGSEADELYSESLVRLTRMPTFYRRPMVEGELAGRAALPLDEDWVVYGCVQSLFKIHPDFDPVIGEILRRDPRGRLVLVDSQVHPDISEQFNDRLERTLPDVVDRIHFLPRLSEVEYFNLLVGADALLDTIHFGGGSTTYESLAFGAPVVTWPGRFARSRVTEGCYTRMGMADVVARSAAEYVDSAIGLAHDRDRKEQLRARILAANDVLYEDVGAVRELEAFFQRALDSAKV